MAKQTAERWGTALVTGASSGIGDAFARLLAAEGTDLVVVARDRARLEELATDLVSAHGVTVEVMAADLADAGQLSDIEARLADADHPIHLLVNNAGSGTVGRFWELPVDGEDAEIRLNVVALSRLTHAALGPMVQRGGGAVLNVASIAGLIAGVGCATYNATKAFVVSLGDSVHEELAGTGVTLTTLLPGFTRTEFQARAAATEHTDNVPDFAWMSAEAVASAALDATAAGRTRVVPGAVNRAVSTALDVVPTAVVRRVAGVSLRRAL